ncbi:unnamed protein product [Blepharisma stoltei]|uniref:Uncharacterized protein n=1 Tax=Blepharisma stoltei TaxID=1481888 RepID=A0AAU9IAV2_9CILI|nr:unnamed protein product [Blepharisma stoltei]
MESMALYRTFMPKYTHYSSDGGGRDNYISANNGGFISSSPTQSLSFNGTGLGKNRRFYSPVPKLPAPITKYHSDGSGRDIYIAHNSGGLQAAYIPGSYSNLFAGSLRKHPRVRNLESDSFMKATFNYQSKQSRQSMRKNKKIIDKAVLRLSRQKSINPSNSTEKLKYKRRCSVSFYQTMN